MAEPHGDSSARGGPPALDGDLTLRGGHLVLDGVDLVELARVNPTPFFVYSSRRIRWNVSSLVNAFTRRHLDTEVFFASKACSNLWFLDEVQRAGVNVEVNSGGELWKARRAGFAGRRIVFNGVAKTRDEIAAALHAGVRGLTVDSLFELERIADVAGELGLVAPVDLRIDVHVPTLTHPGLVTAHGGKAGIDWDDALDAFAYAAGHERLDPRGLHLHIGSQITAVEPYRAAVDKALDLIDVVEASGVRLERLNAGGGFAVPYRDKPVCEPVDYFCAPLTIDDYAEAVCETVERRRPGLKLLLEPGRFIAGSAALLVTTVENTKVKGCRDEAGRRIGDERWLTVDAGFNTLLEHTNYHWYYRTLVANRAGEPADTPFRLAGPLCDSGDVFAGDDDTPYRLFPAATAPGDVIVFFDAGAYVLEMMNPYNARPQAAAFAVEGGAARLIRRADTLEDMVAHDVAPRRAGAAGRKRAPQGASRRTARRT
jgi:diaminopimelate decarboxylase